jgi:hypothetical protein
MSCYAEAADQLPAPIRPIILTLQQYTLGFVAAGVGDQVLDTSLG